MALFDSSDAYEADYVAEYTGEGTYSFGPDNFGYVDMDEGTAIAFVEIWISDGDHLCYAGKNTVGSMMFMVGEEEKPETAVPEPASTAYALLGLGSLLGIKRRIKK